MEELNKSILVWSDPHGGAIHPDAFEFVKALHDKYKFTRSICLGDEFDLQWLNRFCQNQDLPNGASELDIAIGHMVPFYNLFPNTDVLNSNHPYRLIKSAKMSGILRKMLKSKHEIFQAPKTWTWHQRLIIELPNKLKVIFQHTFRKVNSLLIAKECGMCAAQGHRHHLARINYEANGYKELWGANVPGLFDQNHMAMEYAMDDLDMPIGVMTIIDSVPAMHLMRRVNNRWIGEI